jgi:hypothetical protein
MSRPNIIFISSVIIFLSGCGGGGGGSNSSVPAAPSVANFSVIATVDGAGSISPASVTVASGESTSFTLTADTGSNISDISGCNGTLTGTNYTTGTITQNCSIVAVFEVASDDISAPLASIVFPWAISRTNARNLTVRGTASDANSIAAIRVNGVNATIQQQTVAQAASFSPSKRAAVSDGSQAVLTIVQFEASVPIPEAEEVTIVVETEDALGNIDATASTAQVFAQTVPTNFVIDPVNSRLIGQTGFNEMIILDLVTADIETLTLPKLNAYDAFTYVDNENTVIYSALTGDVVTLYSIDLDDGGTTILINHDLNLDPAVTSFVHIREIDFAQTEGAAYIALIYFSAVPSIEHKTVILKYDLASDTVSTVLDGKTTTDKPVRTESIAFTTNGLLVFGGFWSEDDSLLTLELDGSDVTPISTPANLLSSGIDVDAAEEFAYLTGFSGITKVDLVSGDKSALSLETALEELRVSQIRSTGLDEFNNRLLIADSDLDVIIAVDLDSGERSKFVTNGVGDGPIMVAPRELVLDEENNVVYVADDGGNASEAVFAIDLTTGNRKQVSHINKGSNVGVQDIVLDSDNQQLYVVFSDEIIQIDIQSEAAVTISGTLMGSGEILGSYSGAALDLENNRLIVADFASESLASIDLTSGDRAFVSKEGSVGTGDALEGSIDVALDLENDRAFVISQLQGALFSVDLTTGDRELVLDSCRDNSNIEKLGPDSTGIQNIFFDQLSRQLLITADSSFLTYDVDSTICTATNGLSLFDILITSNDQIMGTQANQLVQVDPSTGEQVIISK